MKTSYRSLLECVQDLEKHGHLVRVREEVDPYLEMAAIHSRVFENQGPAILYEKVKGCKFPAVSNLFGTSQRTEFMFRDTLDKVALLIKLKSNPLEAIKNPLRYWRAAPVAWSALPIKCKPQAAPVYSHHASIEDLPAIMNWPLDGGPFITMPQVYTEALENPGILHANLGMYRIQLYGNDYIMNEEVGVHYQLHRGIGIHHAQAIKGGQPLKVSVFIGGPPAHAVAAVMPLPEGLSELTFAGALGNQRFRYFYDQEGFCISADADFVITGTISNANKNEGPFGDHLGYYSLKHPFPVLNVRKVYHRSDAIWPFTVVGRPPQEDTSFGKLIHKITGWAVSKEIPGLHQIHAVDAAGVHPLLLAVGSERYTPYEEERKPKELLTIASRILGTNQLSLAKYLFIAAKEDDPHIDVQDIARFLNHTLERIDFTSDFHFHTKTTMDTLDYSGGSLHVGSKVVIAAAGKAKRKLWAELPNDLTFLQPFASCKVVLPGIFAIELPPFKSYAESAYEIHALNEALSNENLQGVAWITLCDDASFVAKNLNNFLWVTFTKSNPSHDLYGINSFIEHKHWGCQGPVLIDARAKPHHAPMLVKDPAVEKSVARLALPGKSLHGII